MPDSISWSVSAGSPSGGGISDAGRTESDAIFSFSKTFDAAGDETTVELLIDKVDNVTFLSISSDLRDGSVTVEASAGKSALTGPIMLFGQAVKLFATDLSTIKVQNNSADRAAKLTVLIGLNTVSTP